MLQSIIQIIVSKLYLAEIELSREWKPESLQAFRECMQLEYGISNET